MRVQRLAFLLVAVGCAPSLSSFQPAHVPPRGHVQAEAGMDVSIPLGTIDRVLGSARTLARTAQTRVLTTQERRQLIEAGANMALDPPGAVTHVGVAWAPLDLWEIGARYSSGGWRLGLRRQLFQQAERGFDFTIGAGVQRFTYEFPVHELIGDVIRLDDFVRWTVDLPIAVGTSGSWYRVWGGPRLLYNWFDARARLELPGTPASAPESVAAKVGGVGAMLGAQGGVAVGYRHLFVAFELTVVRLLSTARVELPMQPAVDADLGGFVLYPGVALMAEW